MTLWLFLCCADGDDVAADSDVDGRRRVLGRFRRRRGGGCFGLRCGGRHFGRYDLSNEMNDC